MQWKNVGLVLVIALVPFALFKGTGQAAVRAHASVVGGTPAGAGYPFMAFVQIEEPGQEGQCSGTLVAPNLVLTAAHCIVNEELGYLVEPENLHVLLGTTNYLSGGRWYTATGSYVDPVYRIGHSWHDAGLIELPGPAPAPTVALAERAVPPRTTVSVLGWGLNYPTATEDSPAATSELLIGQTVVQSESYCSKAAFPFYPASMICSVDYPTYASATCFGDSGGPMIVSSGGIPIEVGITSHNVVSVGEDGCSTTTPRVDTRADVEAPWVDRIASEHEPALPFLSRDSAVHDVFNVLSSGPLRGHFRGRYQYRVRCRRLEGSKMQCEPEWGAGGSDFYGTVTIFLLWQEGEPVWSYRYRISWVRDSCYTRHQDCHVSTLSA